jgi:hypothetical protein
LTRKAIAAVLNKLTEVVVDPATLVPEAEEPAAETATQIGALVNVRPPGKVNAVVVLAGRLT